MSSSASAIADGLVTMFSAASLFGAGNVSKNSYQVLETSAGSCMVVQWVRYNSTPMTFGTPMAARKIWSFSLKCYVRDTGDPGATVNRVWRATDNVVACLAADDTILGLVDEIGAITATRDPELGYTVGGATWLPFEFTIETLQF